MVFIGAAIFSWMIGVTYLSFSLRFASTFGLLFGSQSGEEVTSGDEPQDTDANQKAIDSLLNYETVVFCAAKKNLVRSGDGWYEFAV